MTLPPDLCDPAGAAGGAAPRPRGLFSLSRLAASPRAPRVTWPRVPAFASNARGHLVTSRGDQGGVARRGASPPPRGGGRSRGGGGGAPGPLPADGTDRSFQVSAPAAARSSCGAPPGGSVRLGSARGLGGTLWNKAPRGRRGPCRRGPPGSDPRLLHANLQKVGWKSFGTTHERVRAAAGGSDGSDGRPRWAQVKMDNFFSEVRSSICWEPRTRRAHAPSRRCGGAAPHWFCTSDRGAPRQAGPGRDRGPDRVPADPVVFPQLFLQKTGGV